jgi:hypothetical protein
VLTARPVLITALSSNLEKFYEEIKVAGKDLVNKVKHFIHEGNVRRVIVRDAQGHTFVEIPLTVATVGVIAAPVLAAIGTLAALVGNFTLVIERVKDDPPV